MKATFSARVGWLGAVLSLLTFLSGKKVSVFFCELFFPKRKVEEVRYPKSNGLMGLRPSPKA